jgi:aspartokinase/homoserine dehydrogenase 1
MGDNNISVSIISQGSSERGIGLVVAADKATTAMIELEKNSKMISIRKMSIK